MEAIIEDIKNIKQEAEKLRVNQGFPRNFADVDVEAFILDTSYYENEPSEIGYTDRSKILLEEALDSPDHEVYIIVKFVQWESYFQNGAIIKDFAKKFELEITDRYGSCMGIGMDNTIVTELKKYYKKTY